ncbi:tropomyosin-like [Ambystoma mexicanum]|uniref:tropomyosin-like n=1 Tax=Ambystoma mexicanum TaxID=8296 RepID=UPI0037E7D81F
MVKYKLKKASTQSRMEQYTMTVTTVPTDQKTPCDTVAMEENLSLRDVMNAFANCCTSMERQMDGISADVSLLRHDLPTLSSHTGEAEWHISEREDGLHTVEQQMSRVMARLKTLEERVDEDEVKTDMQLMRQDTRNLTERVSTAQADLQETTETTLELTTKVQELETQVTRLEARSEEAEGRARRNNIRILGIREDMEGTNPTEYVESLIL